MVPEIKLVLTSNGKVTTVTKETNTQPLHLLKSLQEFQQKVNATLTKIIEEQSDSCNIEENGDDEDMDAEDSSSERSKDDEDNLEFHPKKRKK